MPLPPAPKQRIHYSQYSHYGHYTHYSLYKPATVPLPFFRRFNGVRMPFTRSCRQSRFQTTDLPGLLQHLALQAVARSSDNKPLHTAHSRLRTHTHLGPAALCMIHSTRRQQQHTVHTDTHHRSITLHALHRYHALNTHRRAVRCRQPRRLGRQRLMAHRLRLFSRRATGR